MSRQVSVIFTCHVATENSEKSEIFDKYFHNRISKIVYVALTTNKQHYT